MGASPTPGYPTILNCPGFALYEKSSRERVYVFTSSVSLCMPVIAALNGKRKVFT
jgi:hypothetical protein